MSSPSGTTLMGNSFLNALCDWDGDFPNALLSMGDDGAQELDTLFDLGADNASAPLSESSITNHAADVDPAGLEENTGAVSYSDVPGSGASAGVYGDYLDPEPNFFENAINQPSLEHSVIEDAVNHAAPDNNTADEAVSCLTPDSHTTEGSLNHNDVPATCASALVNENATAHEDITTQGAGSCDEVLNNDSLGGLNVPESPMNASTSTSMDEKDRIIADLQKQVRDLEAASNNKKELVPAHSPGLTGDNDVAQCGFSPQLQYGFSQPTQYGFSPQLPFDCGFGAEYDMHSNYGLDFSPPGIFSPQSGYEQSPGVSSANTFMARTSTTNNALAQNNIQTNSPSPPVNEYINVSTPALQASLMKTALGISNPSAGGGQFSIGNTPDPFSFEPPQSSVSPELSQTSNSGLAAPTFENEIDLVKRLYPKKPDTQATQNAATLTPAKKGKGKANTGATSTPRKPRARKASPNFGGNLVDIPSPETSPSDDGAISTPSSSSSSSSSDQVTTNTPNKKRGRKPAAEKNTSPTKRARKTTKVTKATETPAVPPPEVQHLLPKPPLPQSAQMWDKKRVDEEQRIFNQAAYVAADPATRGRPLSELMNTAFENLSQGEKARLLLPLLNGMDPFEVDETDEATRKLSADLGIGYGAARERIACMKAQRKAMDEEAAAWEKVTQA